MSAIAPPLETETQNSLNWPAKAGTAAASAVGCTGLFALTATLLTINPIGGAIFGLTYSLAGTVASYSGEAAGLNNSFAGKVATVALSIITGTIAAWALTSAVGYPITFAASACLVAVSLPVAIGVAVVVGLPLAALGCCAIANGWIGIPAPIEDFLNQYFGGMDEDYIDNTDVFFYPPPAETYHP